MKNTTYTFRKDGKAYSANAKNRFEAQDQIELAFGISLSGATFEEVSLNRIYSVFMLVIEILKELY